MKLVESSLDPLLDFYALDRPINWDQVFGRNAEIIVEIGFGMGEVLLKKAQEHPDVNFIGIEFNWERIYKTIKSIDRYNKANDSSKRISNIRILRIDARVAFERLFVEKSISHIYSLFPCPWPKKGHIKNRLFSRTFLQLLNSRMVDDGSLQVVTDYYPYFEWVKEENDADIFHLTADGIKPQFGTKFEKKWLEEGQEEFFELNLLKNNHIHCTVKEDVELKSYKLQEFNPQKFTFDTIKGEVSVVLKDKIYDKEKEQMLIRVIVSEQHLMQNFWAMIRKDKDFWRLCKMEGQHFFPTPGINQALESIYQAAIENNPKN